IDNTRVLWEQHFRASTTGPADPVSLASKLAANHFWSQLQSYTFTATATPGPSWLHELHAPFIGVRADGTLRVVLPPDE
ncbi:MAG: hypothetical protein ACK5PF_06605, partial [bacterium]